MEGVKAVEGEVGLVNLFELKVIFNGGPDSEEGFRGRSIVGAILRAVNKVEVTRQQGVNIVREREERAKLSNLIPNVVGARGGEV